MRKEYLIDPSWQYLYEKCKICKQERGLCIARKSEICSDVILSGAYILNKSPENFTKNCLISKKLKGG